MMILVQVSTLLETHAFTAVLAFFAGMWMTVCAYQPRKKSG